MNNFLLPSQMNTQFPLSRVQ